MFIYWSSLITNKNECYVNTIFQDFYIMFGRAIFCVGCVVAYIHIQRYRKIREFVNKNKAGSVDP